MGKIALLFITAPLHTGQLDGKTTTKNPNFSFFLILIKNNYKMF